LPEPSTGRSAITPPAAESAPPRGIRTVAVIGAGYVGLPLSLHLAKAGLSVTAVDIDRAVVAEINERRAKVEEKEDFEKYFQDPDVQSNLRASAEPVTADAFIIAVPTPVYEHSKEPDLRAVTAATESIVPFLRRGNLVIVESTIPPHTTERIVAPILERSGLKAGADFLLAHCPERILPGNIMAEAVYNARIIGGIDEESTRAAAALMATFVKGKLLSTNSRTAEFVKLIENSYRDVNVAFANQVAILCETLGIDTAEAIALANEHPRVDILDPGIGVGGHCIPVDPWFLVHACPDASSLVRSARLLNDAIPARTAAKILAAVADVEHPRVACLGASYKPNVRDLRESPALQVFELLRGEGLDVELHDPLIAEYACDSVLSAARGADLLAILVPHDLIVTELRYRRGAILAAMRRPRIIAFSPGVI
jgi:UDP-N-acetyl-D-mannosaminuronic acid dehydrogenase